MFKEMLNEKFLSRLLIGLAFIYFVFGLNIDMNLYDEGVGLIGAERTGIGQIPYRDFWTIYAPLNYYLTAGFSLLFGGSVTIARMLSMFVAVFTIFILHKIIRKSNFHKPKFTAGLVLIFTMGYSLFYARPMGAAVMFAAIAILFFLKPYIDDASKYKLNTFFSGFFLGLVFLTRIDTGVYLLISFLLSLIIYKYLRKNNETIRQIPVFKSVLLITAGFIATTIPMIVYLSVNAGFGTLYNQLITVPAEIYGPFRKVPRIHLWDVVNATGLKNAINIIWFGIFSLMTGATAILILIKYRKDIKRNINLDNRPTTVIPLIVFAILLLSQTIVRPDNEHFLPSWIFTITALFVIFDRKVISNKAGIVFAIFMILFAGYFIADKFAIPLGLDNKQLEPITKIPRAEKIYIGKEWKKDLEPAVAYVRDNSKRTDRIFVANDRHDKGYRNDALFYFLAERLPATRYHELHPGVVSTSAVQKEIISELEAGVRFIIKAHDINSIAEQNLSSKSSGIRLLDNYIKNNFHTERKFGIYEVMTKN